MIVTFINGNKHYTLLLGVGDFVIWTSAKLMACVKARNYLVPVRKTLEQLYVCQAVSDSFNISRGYLLIN